jgi:hypothetical protein
VLVAVTGGMDELTPDIPNIIAKISPFVLQAVSANILLRSQLRMQHADVQFQNFL